MTGEVGFGAFLARGADRGQMAAVFAAARGKGGVIAFGHGQQPGGGGTQRRRAGFTDRAAQEHPAAFLSAFG